MADNLLVHPVVGTTTFRATDGGGKHWLRTGRSYLGAAPLLLYIGLFLLLPTGIVVFGAIIGDHGFTADNLRVLGTHQFRVALTHSLVISAASSLIGALVGAVLACALSTTDHSSLTRRFVTSACGVLALFGGVSLAFAFIATFGSSGQVAGWLRALGLEAAGSGQWLYSLTGLTIVYLYFQIPLMVLTFLPALDGLQPQWREAAESLGCTPWEYWRYVGIPLVRPAFMSATILLFANAFSAFATVAALITQGGTVVPLQISNALSSEVGAGAPHTANALALAMVATVAIVMTIYGLLQRKASRWAR